MIEKLPGGEWNYRRCGPRPSRHRATRARLGLVDPVHQRYASSRARHGALAVVAARRAHGARARQPGQRRAHRQVAADDRAGAGRIPEGRRAGAASTVRFPLVRSPIPTTKIRLLDVAALRMEALPFRPPAAHVTAMTGSFRVQRRLALVEGRARATAEVERAGRRRLHDSTTATCGSPPPRQPARVRRFPLAVPAHARRRAAARAAMLVQWQGATQDYVIRSGDVRTGGAHIMGDIGVTMTDTVVLPRREPALHGADDEADRGSRAGRRSRRARECSRDARSSTARSSGSTSTPTSRSTRTTAARAE